MTTVFTEGRHAAEFLISEGPGQYSREAVTVASGQNLTAGAVLGRLTVRQAAAPIPTIDGTGTGVMSGLTFGPDAQIGSYVITLLATSATAAFSVVAPDGTALPNGAVGTAYRSSHLSFTVADGGTMTIGDAFTVVVTAAGTPVLVGTGTGVVSAVTLGPNAQRGTYRVRLLATSATAQFEVQGPSGLVGMGNVGTAFTSDHVNFSLANGGTMTEGDYFNLIVANGTDEVTAFNPAAVDGTQHPIGVLWDAVDASLAAQRDAAIVRLAEIKAEVLAWGATVTAAQKNSALTRLQALGLIAR